MLVQTGTGRCNVSANILDLELLKAFLHDTSGYDSVSVRHGIRKIKWVTTFKDNDFTFKSYV